MLSCCMLWRFLPCGGDTSKRISSKLCKWAMAQESELMQVTILAMAEGNMHMHVHIYCVRTYLCMYAASIACHNRCMYDLHG